MRHGIRRCLQDTRRVVAAAGQRVGGAPQHLEQRRGSCRERWPDAGAGGLQSSHEFIEQRRVSERLEQGGERAFVQSGRATFETARDDVIPIGVAAATAFAQDLGVVDFVDREVLPSGCGPCFREPAGADQVTG